MDNQLYVIIPYYNYNDNLYSYNNLHAILNSGFEYCVKVVLVEGILEGQKPLSNLPEAVYKHMVFDLPNKIWVQHNLINLALRNLENWEYAAWVDRDIIFTDPAWASKVIDKLRGGVDILQPYSECVFLNQNMEVCLEETSTFFTNAEENEADFKIISYMKSIKDDVKCDKKKLYRHPGQTWAISKSFFQKIDGIFDKGILGANDMITCLMLGQRANIVNYYSLLFKAEYFLKNIKFMNANFDYVEGLIQHRTHGTTSKRKYYSRYDLFTNDKSFDLVLDVGYNENGVVCLTERGLRFAPSIESYFLERGD